jgi:hypothetical protein
LSLAPGWPRTSRRPATTSFLRCVRLGVGL